MEDDILKNLSETYSDIPFSLKDKIDQFEESGILFNKESSQYKFFKTEISLDQPDEKNKYMKLSDILITNKIKKKISKFGEIDKIKEEDSIGENSQDFSSIKILNQSAKLNQDQSSFDKLLLNPSMQKSQYPYQEEQQKSQFFTYRENSKINQFFKKNNQNDQKEQFIQNEQIDQSFPKQKKQKILQICNVVKFQIKSNAQDQKNSENQSDQSTQKQKNSNNQNRRETLKIFQNQQLKIQTKNLLKKLKKKQNSSFKESKCLLKKSLSRQYNKRNKKSYQKSFDQYYQRGSNIKKNLQSSAELQRYSSSKKILPFYKSKEFFLKGIESKDSTKHKTLDFLNDSYKMKNGKKTFCCIKKKFLKKTPRKKKDQSKLPKKFMKTSLRKQKKKNKDNQALKPVKNFTRLNYYEQLN